MENIGNLNAENTKLSQRRRRRHGLQTCQSASYCGQWFMVISTYLFSIFKRSLVIRYRPRIFDQVGHQTTSAYIENKHLFTKSCYRQTYQNYEQPPQSLQNLYFQSHFSASKINRIFFSVKNI